MKFIVDNYKIVISGSTEELDSVKKELTFESDKPNFWMKYKGKIYKRFYSQATYVNEGAVLIIRGGLFDYIIKRFPEAEIVERRVALPTPASIIQLQGVEYYDYQREVICAIIASKYGGVISLPTGSGKTYVAGGVIASYKTSYLKPKCLYLVASTELCEQVTEVLAKALGELVGRIGQGSKGYGTRVVVGMVQSIASGIKKGDKEILDMLNEVELVICDEAHHSPAASYVRIFNSMPNVKMKVGLSGTVPDVERAPIKRLGMEGVIGPVVYTLKSGGLISNGFLSMPVVEMHKGNWDVGIKDVFKGVNWTNPLAATKVYAEIRDKAIVNNLKRNVYIDSLVKTFCPEKGVLIIVDMIQHGNNLSDITGEMFIWGDAINREEVFQRFKAGKIPVLITSPILEEGVDVKGISAIILAGGGKSKRKLLQRIGRGMRTTKDKHTVKVFDLMDTETPLLTRHTEERLRVYKEEGWDVKMVDTTGEV